MTRYIRQMRRHQLGRLMYVFLFVCFFRVSESVHARQLIQLPLPSSSFDVE